jgi:hypothetical protein
MTVEQRLDELYKRNKRLTVVLTMTVVAATSDKVGEFDTAVARKINDPKQ